MERNDYDGYEPEDIVPDTLLAWCPYCKSPVFSCDSIKKTKSGKIYHLYCFEQKTGHKKPLKF